MDLKKKIRELTGLRFQYNTFKMKGGDILPPQGRVFKDVVSLDFNSYYPSIIMSYNLFGKAMTEFLASQWDLKEQGDKDAKLLMNSIYGYFKYFDYDKASFVTEIGRKQIRELREILKKNGYRVIYSHTDSVMVCDVLDERHLKDVVNEFIGLLSDTAFVKGKFKLEIENRFKFIYFQEVGGKFLKNKYLGVNHDGSLYFNGMKPNEEELKMIDFIQHKLNKGETLITSKELEEYLNKYYKTTNNNDKFINPDLLNIIDVESHKTTF